MAVMAETGQLVMLAGIAVVFAPAIAVLSERFPLKVRAAWPNNTEAVLEL
jgi:hypothetical protein